MDGWFKFAVSSTFPLCSNYCNGLLLGFGSLILKLQKPKMELEITCCRKWNSLEGNWYRWNWSLPFVMQQDCIHVIHDRNPTTFNHSEFMTQKRKNHSEFPKKYYKAPENLMRHSPGNFLSSCIHNGIIFSLAARRTVMCFNSSFGLFRF